MSSPPAISGKGKSPQGGRVTTGRVWTWSVIAALLIGGLLGFAFERFSTHPSLRSQHGEQATRLPLQKVVITDYGNLFHDPRCTFIKGKTRVVSAEEAVLLGYTPCPRCLGKALQK